LADKQQVTRALIAGGADIREINAIRKHLSRIKGGRLLDFVNGAHVLSLVLSDVIGDDLSGIASGPTCPDPTTFGDCLDIIARYGLEDQFPASALAYLRAGAAGGPEAPPETPKPGDPRFERVRHVIVANNFRALEAASRTARQTGFQPLILTSSLEGDTGEAARFHVAVLREVLQHGHPLQPPACIITGGETTVKVKGDGLGGRNMEFVLHCALAVAGWEPRSLLIASAGTDGTDGPTNAAGAWADCATVARGRSLGLDAADYLRRNDSYRYFQRLDDLVITGPTRTNVMDLRLMLVA
jgi:hydroxypyruvate reductase